MAPEVSDARGPAPVAVDAAYFALRDFAGDAFPGGPFADERGDGCDFDASHVVELEDDGVGFAAVYAWVFLQVGVDAFVEHAAFVDAVRVGAGVTPVVSGGAEGLVAA